MPRTTTKKKPPAKKPPVKKKEEPRTLSFSQLLSQAINIGASIEVINSLMTAKELEMKKEAEFAFNEAFLNFQNELPEILRNQSVVSVENGEQIKKYKFSDLPLIRKVAQPYLFKHGFTYRWDYKAVDNNEIEGICILTHRAGHSVTASMRVPKDSTGDMNMIQATGSTMTYLQRYTLKAVLGLTSVEDDNDGRTATEKKPVVPEPQKLNKDKDPELFEKEAEDVKKS